MLGRGPGRYILGDCDLIWCLSWGLIVWESSNQWWLLLKFDVVVMRIRVSFYLEEEGIARVYIYAITACRPTGGVQAKGNRSAIDNHVQTPLKCRCSGYTEKYIPHLFLCHRKPIIPAYHEYRASGMSTVEPLY